MPMLNNIEEIIKIGKNNTETNKFLYTLSKTIYTKNFSNSCDNYFTNIELDKDKLKDFFTSFGIDYYKPFELDSGMKYLKKNKIFNIQNAYYYFISTQNIREINYTLDSLSITISNLLLFQPETFLLETFSHTNFYQINISNHFQWVLEKQPIVDWIEK